VRSSIWGDKPREGLFETTGGKNQNLPVKSEYRRQGHLLTSPFFRSVRMGFFFFGTSSRQKYHHSGIGVTEVLLYAEGR